MNPGEREVVYLPSLVGGKPLRFLIVDETYPGAVPGKLNLVPDIFGPGVEIRVPREAKRGGR